MNKFLIIAVGAMLLVGCGSSGGGGNVAPAPGSNIIRHDLNPLASYFGALDNAFDRSRVEADLPAIPSGLFVYDVSFTDPEAIDVNVMADFENNVGFIDFINPQTKYRGDMAWRKRSFQLDYQIRDHFDIDAETGVISDRPATKVDTETGQLKWDRSRNIVKLRKNLEHVSNKETALWALNQKDYLYGNDQTSISGKINPDAVEGRVVTVAEPINNQYRLKEFSFEFSGSGEAVEPQPEVVKE